MKELWIELQLKAIDQISLFQMNIVSKIISSYLNNKSLYIGEKVTMTEQMIQTAMLAEKKILQTASFALVYYMIMDISF